MWGGLVYTVIQAVGAFNDYMDFINMHVCVIIAVVLVMYGFSKTIQYSLIEEAPFKATMRGRKNEGRKKYKSEYLKDLKILWTRLALATLFIFISLYIKNSYQSLSNSKSVFKVGRKACKGGKNSDLNVLVLPFYGLDNCVNQEACDKALLLGIENRISALRDRVQIKYCSEVEPMTYTEAQVDSISRILPEYDVIIYGYTEKQSCDENLSNISINIYNSSSLYADTKSKEIILNKSLSSVLRGDCLGDLQDNLELILANIYYNLADYTSAFGIYNSLENRNSSGYGAHALYHLNSAMILNQVDAVGRISNNLARVYNDPIMMSRAISNTNDSDIKFDRCSLYYDKIMELPAGEYLCCLDCLPFIITNKGREDILVAEKCINNLVVNRTNAYRQFMIYFMKSLNDCDKFLYYHQQVAPYVGDQKLMCLIESARLVCDLKNKNTKNVVASMEVLKDYKCGELNCGNYSSLHSFFNVVESNLQSKYNCEENAFSLYVDEMILVEGLTDKIKISMVSGDSIILNMNAKLADYFKINLKYDRDNVRMGIGNGLE